MQLSAKAYSGYRSLVNQGGFYWSLLGDMYLELYVWCSVFFCKVERPVLPTWLQCFVDWRGLCHSLQEFIRPYLEPLGHSTQRICLGSISAHHGLGALWQLLVAWRGKRMGKCTFPCCYAVGKFFFKVLLGHVGSLFRDGSPVSGAP